MQRKSTWGMARISSFSMTGQGSGAAGGGRASVHGVEAIAVGTKTFEVERLGSDAEDLLRPIGEIRMQGIEHSLPLPPGGDDTEVAQHGQMARDLRLALFQRVGQFADTEFTLICEQPQHPQARALGKRAKEIFGRHFVRGIQRH